MPSDPDPVCGDGDAVAPARYRIGRAAELAGVSERTLRYYEELGMLAPAGHRAGGVREYGDVEIARVQQIRELQELIGLNLEEIRSVLGLEDRLKSIRRSYRASELPGERRALLLEAFEMTEALERRVADKVARIAAYRDELGSRLVRYRDLLDELDETSSPSPA